MAASRPPPGSLWSSATQPPVDRLRPPIKPDDHDERTTVDPEAVERVLLADRDPASRRPRLATPSRPPDTLDPPRPVRLASATPGPHLPMGTPPAEAAAPSARPVGGVNEAFFVVSAGADRGRRFPIGHRRISIGRAMDNEIVLTDIAVSRKHLIIEFDGTHHVLTDLGSGNGTLVNGRDEDGTYRLFHGDRLELGNTILVFECPAMSSVAAMAHGAAPKHWGRSEEDSSTVAGKKARGEQAGSSLAASAVAELPPPGPISTIDLPPESHAAMPAPYARSGPGPGPVAMTADLRSRPHDAGAETMLAPPSHRASAGVRPLPGALAGQMSGGALPPAAIVSPLSMAPTGPLTAGPLTAGPLTAPPSGAPFPVYPSQLTYPSQLSYPAQTPHGLTGPTSLAGAVLHPPLEGDAPRFSYPTGRPETRDKRWMLIAVLATALVATIGGITLALRKNGDGAAAASMAARAAAIAGRATAATRPAPLASAGEPKIGPLGGAGDGPTLASLTSGTRALPASTFGTDEAGLVGTGTAARHDRTASRAATDDRTASRAAADDRGGGPGKPSVAGERARSAADALVQASDSEDGEPAHRPSAEIARRVAPRAGEDRRSGDRASPSAADLITEGSASDDPSGGTALDDDHDGSGTADAARDRATSLYGDKKFAEGAAVLRRAAKQAAGAEAARLQAAAAGYDKVAAAIADAVAGNDPAVQFKAWKTALKADAQAGDGEHQAFIGNKLALLAPRVAGSFMAGQKYAEARAVCDDAERFGGGKDVARIRESLERKAAELATDASRLTKLGKEDEAAELVATVLKMVPRTSPAYARAQALAR